MSALGARVAVVEAPLALYRRYRPETFAEVIGQDHVTAPLRNALSNNRVNHAYLFSGPRGCGKTTSARILARAINCEKGPIAEPCGVCKSCTDLARGGPGSIDVIEIDAASHGGVDDARDLRERAFFAPVESRYKIYIIDEAHMVTTQGFNALLKLVEEPPPHLKFIFATTEPDKVIGTIRSRTHHYPFRLVPPKALGDYMATLCEAEGVAIAPAALPLVVRAGAGSVRDSLSVLDQLIGGAGPEGVTYELAVALLGFTPDSLLDACVDGFAAHDSRAVFETVEKVIETGQDPKRFAEDLLRRLRDLVILSAVPNAVASGLIEAAEDQGERLQTQAAGIGAAELTRAADIVAAGLLEMRGATAPRLQLELICAKVLLPGADDSTNGIQARLDRMERRFTIGVPAGTAEAAPAAPVARPGGTAAADGRGSGSAEVAGPGAGRGAAAGAVGGPGGSGAGESAGTGAAGAVGGPGGAGASGSAGAGAPGAGGSAGAGAPGAGGSADGRGAGADGGSAAGDASPAGTAAGAADGSAPGAGGPAGAAGAGGSGSGGGAGSTGAGTAGGASPAGGNGGAGSAGAAAGAGRGGSAPASAGSGGGNRTGAWADESGSAAPVSGGQSTAAAQVAPAAAAPVSSGPVGLADVRRLWPEVLEAVKSKRRFAWIMLSQNAQVIAVDEQILTLGLVNAGARESFARSGSDEILRQAMIDTIGLNRRVEAVVDPSTDPGAGSGAAPPPAPPSAPPSSSWDQAPSVGQPGAGGPGAGGSYGDAGGAGGDGSGAAGYGDQGGAAGSHGGGAAGGSYGGGAGAAGAGTDGLGAGGSGDGGSGSGGVGADGPGAGPAAHEAPGGGAGVNGSAGYGEPSGTSGAADDGFAGTGGAEVAGAGANGAGGAAGGGIAGPGAGGVGGAGAAAQEVSAGSGSAGNGGAGSAGSAASGGGSAGSGGAGGGGAGWGDGAVGAPGPGGVGAAAGGAVAVQEFAGEVRVPLQADQQAGGPPAPSAAPEVDRREQAASKRRAAEAAVAAEQARKAAAAPEVQEVPLTPEEEAMAIGDDDVVLEEDSRSHTDLLRETLGASIINEEPN
ncbi:DNA polymerase III subunit gamma and tau [Kribbella endophytica]